MRILLLTPFLPDPVAPHGGGSYLGAVAERLAKRSELGLLHFDHPGEVDRGDGPWRWRRSVPYVGEPPPGGRLRHRCNMLWRWRSRPLLAAKYWHPALPPLLREARAEFAPDVVLVELAQMAQYLPFIADLPSVLTDHEAGRPANAATGLGVIADRRDEGLWTRYLRRYYPMADVVQALTEDDAETLHRLLGRADPVRVRPPAVRIPADAIDPGAAPPRVLFFGDYRHQPNREAAERLARDVLPPLRRRQPDAELWLAGGHEAPIKPLAGIEGVRVCGFVDDLTALLANVRCALVPLWSGRGFRVKAATALAYGLPVVANELGTRGVRAPDPACLLAESAEELAAAAARHLDDGEHASRAGQLARQWAQKHLSADAVADRQLEDIESMLARR